MLTKVDELRLAVLKADERMLPVADMVAPSDIENDITEIVAIEVEPESIDDAVSLVDSNQDCWCVASSSTGFRGTLRRPLTRSSSDNFPFLIIIVIRYILLSSEPVRSLFHVVIAC